MSKSWNLTESGPIGPWKPERSEIKTITPVQAAWLLEHCNVHNRPIVNASVKIVEDALVGGTWICNGETIIFGWDLDTGSVRLEDGQNRLWACVNSGKSMKTWVCFRRVCPDAFMTIDRGRNRNSASDLGIKGEKHTTDLAAALLVLRKYDEGVRSSILTSSPRLHTRDLLETLEKHPGLRESVRWTVNHKSKIKAPPRVISPVHYLAGLDASPKVLARRDEFFARLADGTNLDAGSPILALRHRLDQMASASNSRARKNAGSLGAFQCLWVVVRAWNAFLMGHELGKLQLHFKDGDRRIPADIPDVRSYFRRPSGDVTTLDESAANA